MSEDSTDLRKRLGLHSRVPPHNSFVSLSRAISWIALRRSIEGPVFSKLLGIGKQQCEDRIDRNERLDRATKSAVEKLTDLGLAGRVKFLGREYDHVLVEDRDNNIPTERIPAERLADYRGFDTLNDTLFPEPYRQVSLAWGRDRTEVRSPLEKHYRFVIVNRVDLMRQFPAAEDRLAPRPFTDAERTEWIKLQPQQSADNAHKKFKSDARWDGTKQREFRKEWKAKRGTQKGRPTGKS